MQYTDLTKEILEILNSDAKPFEGNAKVLALFTDGFEDIAKELNDLFALHVVVVNEADKKFKPCGEGDNICNCKNASECGYSSEVELFCSNCKSKHVYQPEPKSIKCYSCGHYGAK